MNALINTPAAKDFVPSRRAALSGVGKGLGALAGMAAMAVTSGTANAQTAAPAAAGSAAAAKPQSQPLKGKAAIVTGARNNQGRAYSAELAKMGADVVVHYHRAETRDQAEETARLVRAAGQRAVLVQGDLGDAAVAKACFDAAINSFGRVDILVNTAGVIIKKPLAEVTAQDYERSHRANTASVLFTMSEAARRMADNGRIINIGTSLTVGSAPQYALYGGTKAPGEEFTRMMAREVGRRGITINTVAPGPLDNPFFHAAETPQSVQFASNLSVSGRLGKVEDITPIVAFLAGPESQWVNGQTLFVNGGYITR